MTDKRVGSTGSASRSSFLMLIILIASTSGAVAALTDVSIQKIEVTQAIQCFDDTKGYTKCPDNSLELSDHKSAAVRVYLGHEGGPACPANDPFSPVLKGVKVKLEWLVTPPAVSLPTIWEETFDVPCSKTLDVLRGDPKGSKNFILPSEILGRKPGQEKTLTITAKVITNISESDTTNNEKELVLKLHPRNGFTVAWVPVYYVPDAYKKEPSKPYQGPSVADLKQVAGASPLIKRMYPLPVTYSRYPGFFPWVSTIQNPKNFKFICKSCPDIRDIRGTKDDALLDMLEKFRLMIKPRPSSLVGWLPNEALTGSKANSCEGWTTGVNLNLGDPPEAPSWITQCPTANSSGHLLAHEVWHSRGMDHTEDESCWPFPKASSSDTSFDDIKETGYDISKTQKTSGGTTTIQVKGSVVKPTSTDISVSAASFRWMSPYGWNRLIGKSFTKEWSKCDFSSPPSGGSDWGQPGIQISGEVHDDGSAELAPVYQYVTQGAPRLSDPSGDYCLDLRALDHSTLSSYCFDLPVMLTANGSSVQSRHFSYLLPSPPGVWRVVLRRGTAVLDERRGSLNSPGLTIVSPQAGDVFSGPMPVSFTTSDSDGDELVHAVLYSPDGGTSLFPIAIDTEATSSDVDTTSLPGGDNALVRVMVSDGFHTVSMDSPPFRVMRKPPTVQIITPEDGSLLDVSKDVVMIGHADDLEDGELDGTKLAWTSDRDGPLGSGSELIVPDHTLSPGEHEITLTATDSDLQTASDSITVNVFLPVEIDIKPFSDPNSVNTKRKGVVPVAICNGGSVDNDVDLDDPSDPHGFSSAHTNIDVSTIRFALDPGGSPLGATTAAAVHDLGDAAVLGEHLTQYIDTDFDGLPDTLVRLDAPRCEGDPVGPDLVVHFPQRDTGLAEGHTEACVRAELTSGVVIIGCDKVRIVK